MIKDGFIGKTVFHTGCEEQVKPAIVAERKRPTKQKKYKLRIYTLENTTEEDQQ